MQWFTALVVQSGYNIEHSNNLDPIMTRKPKPKSPASIVYTNQRSSDKSNVLCCWRATSRLWTAATKLRTTQACALQKTQKPKFGNARKCENGLTDTSLFGSASVPRSLSFSHTQRVSMTFCHQHRGCTVGASNRIHSPTKQSHWCFVPANGKQAAPLAPQTPTKTRVAPKKSSASCARPFRVLESGRPPARVTFALIDR